MLYQLSYCGNCGAKVIYLKKHRNSFSLFFSYQTKKEIRSPVFLENH
jgi:hypothetical protein